MKKSTRDRQQARQELDVSLYELEVAKLRVSQLEQDVIRAAQKVQELRNDVRRVCSGVPDPVETPKETA